MLSPVTRGQKSLIRTAECLEFFKHPFEMRDDAKRPHFYVNPEQDTATGVLLPGRDCRARPGRTPGPPRGWRPGRAPVCAAAAAPSLRDAGSPERPGPLEDNTACPESCGAGGRDERQGKKIKKEKTNGEKIIQSFISRLKKKKKKIKPHTNER